MSGDLTILDINSDAEQLFADSRGACAGTPYDRWVAALDGGFTPAELLALSPGTSVRDIDGRVSQPDGSERILIWNAAAVEAQGCRLIILAGSDQTGFQRAEEALREREARMSSVIDTAPDAIVTIDHMGIIQSFSQAAETLFGYAAGEAIGRSITLLMAAADGANHQQHVDRYLATREPHIIGIGRKVKARHKDGTIFPVELAVGEVSLGSSRIFTGFIRDLRARVRLEDELRHAQKMEAVGQLTGGVAHDFNNLLTVIIGNLEMLEPRVQDGLNREILGEAQEAAQLGADLANRLLAFGRRQPLHARPMNLSALVAGMADLLRRTLGASIEIKTVLALDLPLIVADPGGIENALLNLAINARDAMPNGGSLEIETRMAVLDDDYISAHPEARGGRYVSLVVTDTGTGMDEETRLRAFDPFFTTKDPGRGTGLGLSTVYGVVTQMGGSVNLYSELGQGTTVRIYLPVAEGATVPPPEISQPPVAAAKGATVLVVEDDSRVRKVSARRLAELGYRVIEADGARQALDILESAAYPIHVLFTDMIMPGGLSGAELAGLVKQRWPTIKILLTSGYADPGMLKSSADIHGLPWLSKPYRIGELADKLAALLGGGA